jgi:HEAT repeat protein
MRTFVAISILLLVVLLVSLVVYIIGRRTWTTALAWLKRRRSKRLAAALDGWLATADETVPVEIERMWRFPDRALFVNLCLDRLQGPDPGPHHRLVGWLESQGLVRGWLRDLASRNHWKRARAAEMLGKVRVQYAVGPLIEALADPVFDVRMRAARALGALGGHRARRALVATLADETRWSVIRIADLLSGMGTQVVTELIEAFPGMSRASRLATLDLIAHLGDASATDFLIGCIDDLDRDVRARAAAATGRIGDRRGLPAVRIALQDTEWPVRAMSAKALGQLGDTGSIAGLCASLRDPEWWVRANAGEALHALGAPGVNALVGMLDDQDQFARDQALATLESSGYLDTCLAGIEVASSAGADALTAIRVLESLMTRHPRSRVDALRDRLTHPAARRAIDQAIGQANERPQVPREASL